MACHLVFAGVISFLYENRIIHGFNGYERSRQRSETKRYCSYGSKRTVCDAKPRTTISSLSFSAILIPPPLSFSFSRTTNGESNKQGSRTAVGAFAKKRYGLARVSLFYSHR